MKRSKNVVFSYTLIELLIVIAVIVLLASMLLPALQKARARAWQSRCASQLKQLSIITNLYLQDYNGTFFLFYDPDETQFTWYSLLKD